MSVELSPAELGFRRPFNHQVSQALRIKNPGNYPIAFKVKTTAPKQYCVRPNSGRVEAGDTLEVQVILQPMKEDPPLHTKCRDKFLVQSIVIPPHQDSGNIANLWHEFEQSARASIQEKKIRVAYLGADDYHGEVNGTMTHGSEPPPYDTPMSDTKSDRAAASGSATPVGPALSSASRPADSKHLGDARASVYNPARSTSPAQSEENNNSGGSKHEEQHGVTSLSSSLASATTGWTAALPTSADALKAQLAEAQATVARLTAQLEDGVVRQRKNISAAAHETSERVTDSVSTTATKLQQQSAKGVPVPWVAGLCLFCFLLAYFFF